VVAVEGRAVSDIFSRQQRYRPQQHDQLLELFLSGPGETWHKVVMYAIIDHIPHRDLWVRAVFVQRRVGFSMAPRRQVDVIPERG
jgi:hypothetical protein